MPLSVQGLCDAEITTPAANPPRARNATAGVVTTPALCTVAPAHCRPRVSDSAIHALDSRVSCPITTPLSPCCAFKCRPNAAPTANTVARSSGGSPATPRIPSVPNSILIGQ